MDKLLAVSECAVGNHALSLIKERDFGIKCKNYHPFIKYLYLFKWAYTSNCVENIEDCSGGTLCNLKNILGKLTKFCKDCRPKKYQEALIELNGDYEAWYNSQDYLDCLRWELENNGYIEPMIDLCRNLNIEISTEAFCKALILNISAQKLDCFVLTDIQVQQACTTIITELSAQALCKDIDTDINTTLPED